MGQCRFVALLIQFQPCFQLCRHHLPKLKWLKDFDTSGPAEKPVGNFFQTVDSERKDNATIKVGRGLLSGVPLSLGHHPGGSGKESNLNVKGL